MAEKVTFCILRRRAKVKVSSDGVCAFLGLSEAFASPGSKSFVFQKASCLNSTTAILLDHVSTDCGDVTVVLVELRWTPRRFHISSTTAIDYSFFQVGIAVRTLLFGRIFEKFEDLGVVHVGDQILRFSAEFVDLLRLAQVHKEGFLVLVALELLDQFLDLVLTCCIQLLDCRKRYSRYSVIHDVAASFTITLRIA